MADYRLVLFFLAGDGLGLIALTVVGLARCVALVVVRTGTAFGLAA